jgi:NitT/TauT family transport system substrate-binding protein
MVKIAIHTVMVLLIFWGAVSGCSGPQNETDPNSDRKLDKVSLQLQWVTQAQFAGYYTAFEKGWYEEEGIDMTIYPGGPDIVPVDLVAAGSRDFGTTLLADLAVKIGQGKPVISIAQIQQNNGLRLLAKKESQINGPQDFVGKKVGVWLGGWEAQFNALLAHAGISPDQVNVISQGFSMIPFLEGRLDVASAMIYNEYHMVLDAGIKPRDLIVVDYGTWNLGFPGDVLFTSEKMRTAHPDLCIRMLRASLKGWMHSLDHQEEAARIVVALDRSGVAKLDHQRKMMKEIAVLVKGEKGSKLGYGHTDTLVKMIHLLAQYKVLSQPLDVDQIYTSEFINQLTP